MGSRSTEIHIHSREYLEERIEALKSELDKPEVQENPSQVADLLLTLEEAERHRDWINDTRGEAPTGKIDGGLIELGEPSGRGYMEPRVFHSGSQFLGYLEGRPGVVGVVAVQPFGGAPPQDWQRQPIPADVHQRIENSPPVQEAAPSERPGLIDSLEDAWAYCDEFGAECEMDVDSDSPGAE